MKLCGRLIGQREECCGVVILYFGVCRKEILLYCEWRIFHTGVQTRVCTYIDVSTCIQSLFKWFVCIYAFMYVCICVYVRVYVCICVYIVCIQGVTGGKDQTSGGCSLC